MSAKDPASASTLPVSASDPGAQLTLELPGAFLTRELAPASRIYVNRNLRLDAIAWVGFDMDYTLARYHQAAMDRLSIDATVAKMIERGMPESLRHARFDPSFPIRGLHVDRELGNVLKMDRYRYVKRAYHGSRELDRETRRRLYHSRPVHAGTRRFHWVDTLYALPEVAVYAGVVEHLEAEAEARRAAGHDVLPLDYVALFDEVRTSIDLAHQDGSISSVIASDFERFVDVDPHLDAALAGLQRAGKKLFLLTNSRGAYTDAMMRFLLGERWRERFELVVCFARKPGFFQEAPKPFVELDEAFAPKLETFAPRPGVLYEGGSLGSLERLLGVGGDQVLYVGDHIYGDVLRAKKESAWRTMMVVQEMSAELAAGSATRASLARLDTIDALTEQLLDDAREHTRERDRASDESHRLLHERALARVHARLAELGAEHGAIEDAVERAYHLRWGSLFKAGPEVSSFGDQVEQYACLYTDRVSNLGRYAPDHYFRGPLDRMPHER